MRVASVQVRRHVLGEIPRARLPTLLRNHEIDLGLIAAVIAISGTDPEGQDVTLANQVIFDRRSLHGLS